MPKNNIIKDKSGNYQIDDCREDKAAFYSFGGIEIKDWRNLKKAAESSLAIDEWGPMYLLPLVAKRVEREMRKKNSIKAREIAYKEIENIEKEVDKKYPFIKSKDLITAPTSEIIDSACNFFDKNENILRTREKSIYIKLYNLIYGERKLKII